MGKREKGFFNPKKKGEKIIADMERIADFSVLIKPKAKFIL